MDTNLRIKNARLIDRYLLSLAMARGRPKDALAYVSGQRWIEADILANVFHKANEIGSMNADTNPDLAAPVSQSLMELVKPLSIFDRLVGFRRVPPRTAGLTTTSGSTATWDDPHQAGGAAIRLSALSISRFAGLAERRVGAIIAVDKELARVGRPGVDTTLSDDLARALASAVDNAFLDPFSSGSPQTQPTSVTSSGRIFTSSGATLALIDSDLELLEQSVHENGGDLARSFWCMNTLTATHLAGMRGSGGARAFPDVTVSGGMIHGLPVLASANIARSGSPSPGTTYLALICPSRIFTTDRDTVSIETSDRAALEMSSAPGSDASSGTGAASTSLFQTESLAAKAVRYLNWQPADGLGHAATLTGVEY